MIFGKTADVKLKEFQKRYQRVEELRNWHWWFAWYPVELESGRWAWLQSVLTRAYSLENDRGRVEWAAWEYTTEKDLEND